MSDQVEYRPLPRCPRYTVGSDGTIIGPSGKRLAGAVVPGGYRLVLIYPGDGTRKTVSIHILVCETFHGPKPSAKHAVAHWDGDSNNNAASNLRWATYRENIHDKWRHGRMHRSSGELDGMSKLRQSQVLEIRRRYAEGESQRSLAREYGVKQPTISNIITRTTWSHC